MTTTGAATRTAPPAPARWAPRSRWRWPDTVPVGVGALATHPDEWAQRVTAFLTTA
jgi:hypothetical protein